MNNKNIGVIGFPDAKLVKKTVTYDYKNPTLHFEFKDIDVYEFFLDELREKGT